jgi:hypothetical protein
MSAKKFSNLFHLLQTVIPRPPYRSHLGLDLFVHRLFMSAQTWYSELLCFPCLSESDLAVSFTKHPHDLDLPLKIAHLSGSVSEPQSQRHLYLNGFPNGLEQIVRRPNFSPIFTSLFLIFPILSGCTVLLPDVKICSVAGNMSAGADCAQTGSDKTEEMNFEQFINFLEPQVNPDRGAAMCLSSVDFSLIKSALEKACKSLGNNCTKETQEKLEKFSGRMDGLQERVKKRRAKKKESK